MIAHPAMHDKRSESTEELELILQDSGRLVSKNIEPAEFLTWFRTSVPKIAPKFVEAMADADGDSSKMIYGMGRALWNAMPQPSNRYRPRALPKPNRNGRCPCGSGHKFKQCCAKIEPPHQLFESMNLLRYVLDGESKASLKRIDTRSMDPAALDDVARQWEAGGEFERAVLLLEPLFDEGAKPPKHANLLLDTLFDVWPPDYKPQRRNHLAQRLSSDSNPELACVALHRCITMLADSSNTEEAWALFHTGMRRYPEDVNFAGLEVTLLLSEGRVDDARRRAEFWAHRLRRLGTEYYAYADRLISMLDFGEDSGDLELIRTDFPLIDSLALLIESQPIRTDGYAPRPDTPGEPVVLTPTSAMARAERGWGEAVGGDKPMLVMLDTPDEPLIPQQIMTMLEKDPSLLHSFDVLDDISESLDKLSEELAEFVVLLELVLQRAETMLMAIVTGTTPKEWVTASAWQELLPQLVHELPWEFMENRPALRMVVRHIHHLQHRKGMGSVERWLPRAQMLLQINPNDNHAYRELVSGEMLRQQRPADALRLLEHYPDDFLGSVIMNRTLALYILNRQDEAAVALDKGGIHLREMRKAITSERYAKPRDSNDDSVILGGRHEAWLYRQDMLSNWQSADAITWLKMQLVPRKPRQQSPDTPDSVNDAAEPVVALPNDEAADLAHVVPSPLSLQALQDSVDMSAPHGEWLLGLTLAAALTPGGEFAIKRLFKPLVDRLVSAELSDDQPLQEGENTSTNKTIIDTGSGIFTVSDSGDLQESSVENEDVESTVLFNEALTSFFTLYQHFIARLDAMKANAVDPESGQHGGSATSLGESDLSLNWIAEDLSVVSLDKDDARMALVCGLVAGIDGNPRGWSPIPTGPRNSVIGPLRLMAVSAQNASVHADSALANVMLLDPRDGSFLMSRHECLQRITELVKLARLALRVR